MSDGIYLIIKLSGVITVLKLFLGVLGLFIKTALNLYINILVLFRFIELRLFTFKTIVGLIENIGRSLSYFGAGLLS